MCFCLCSLFYRDDVLCWLLLARPFLYAFHAHLRFPVDLVWFRLSCDHGWIRSGSVNVRKQQQQQLVGHFSFRFLVRKIPFAGIELRPKVTSELPGRPACCAYLTRALSRRPAPFLLVLGCSRPMVSVDVEVGAHRQQWYTDL